MIDLGTERLIPLREVGDFVPSARPGKRLNVATVWRWATSGARGRVLETVKIGGSTFTSIEAVERFAQHRAETPWANPPFASRSSRGHLDTELELDDEGL